MELILHLGAHRTGTTALQTACRKNADVLAEDGIQVWGPDLLRDNDFAKYVQYYNSSPDGQDVGRVAETFHSQISNCRKSGLQTLMISEENILGTMLSNFRKRSFYPMARARLETYRTLLEAPPDRIFLCLRDYASFWASSYAFSALRNPLAPFDELRDALLHQPRGWTALVADIRDVFPDSQLILWQQDKSSEGLERLLVEMFGDVAARMTRPKGQPNASWSHGALNQALELQKNAPQTPIKELREAVLPLNGPGAERFQPFSKPEIDALSQRFHLDLQGFTNGSNTKLKFHAAMPESAEITQ